MPPSLSSDPATPVAPPPSAAEAALLARARTGEPAALAALYRLHHDAALRLAQALAGAEAAEDVVAEAYARVLATLTRGDGPRTNFRGYLFAAIRNRQRDLQRRAGRETPLSDQPWIFEACAEAVAVQSDGEQVDGERALAALRALPETWQQVLVLLEVEQRPLGEVAQRLALRPVALSSLAYRAREGLRTAYLDQHVRRTPARTSECAWVRARLSRYVRAALTEGASGRADAHLQQCASCTALLTELQRVNRRFRFGRVSVADRSLRPAGPQAARAGTAR